MSDAVFNMRDACDRVQDDLCCGNNAPVRMFLKYLMNSVGCEKVKEVLNMRGCGVGKEKRTALHIVAANGNTEGARLLLMHNCDMEIKDEKGMTAANVASFHARHNKNCGRVLVALARHGCDVNTHGHDGFTPLLTASDDNNSEGVVRMLLETREDVNTNAKTTKCGHTAAMKLVLNGSIVGLECVVKLKRTNLDIACKSGQTALYFCAQIGHCDMLGLLLMSGADPNCGTSGGYDRWSPLTIASSSGLAGVVSMLMQDPRTDANFHDLADVCTPIMAAAQKSHVHVMASLLAVGSCTDLGIYDNEGETAFDMGLNSNMDARALVDLQHKLMYDPALWDTRSLTAEHTVRLVASTSRVIRPNLHGAQAHSTISCTGFTYPPSILSPRDPLHAAKPLIAMTMQAPVIEGVAGQLVFKSDMHSVMFGFFREPYANGMNGRVAVRSLERAVVGGCAMLFKVAQGGFIRPYRFPGSILEDLHPSGFACKVCSVVNGESQANTIISTEFVSNHPPHGDGMFIRVQQGSSHAFLTRVCLHEAASAFKGSEWHMGVVLMPSPTGHNIDTQHMKHGNAVASPHSIADHGSSWWHNGSEPPRNLLYRSAADRVSDEMEDGIDPRVGGASALCEPPRKMQKKTHGHMLMFAHSQ